MTAYTSFVAVDRVKRGDGTVETVKQPLPLPEGVSDLAVGGGGQNAASLKAGMSPGFHGGFGLMASRGDAVPVPPSFATEPASGPEVSGQPEASPETPAVPALTVQVLQVKGELMATRPNRPWKQGCRS